MLHGANSFSKPSASIKFGQCLVVETQIYSKGNDATDNSDAESYYSVAAHPVKRKGDVTQSQPSDAALTTSATTPTHTDRKQARCQTTSAWTRGESRTKSFSRPFQSASGRTKMISANISIPRRRSSLGLLTKKSQRPDTARLHHQSCQLFSSLDGVLALSRDFTPLPSATTSRSSTRRPSMATDVTPSFTSVAQDGDEKNPILIYSTTIPLGGDSLSAPAPHGDTCEERDCTPEPVRQHLNSIISWTSDETRRQEYSQIDRAHTGIRGLLKKILPKSLQPCSVQLKNFYDEHKVKDDEDSVRRFRMDLPEKGDRTRQSDANGGHSNRKEKVEHKPVRRAHVGWVCFN